MGQQVTDKLGEFHKTITLPLGSAAYRIKAHFSQVYPYGPADSNFFTINSPNRPDSLGGLRTHQGNSTLVEK
jgi:hypothetical protein